VILRDPLGWLFYCDKTEKIVLAGRYVDLPQTKVS
jgi:hypothetical protein